MLQVRYVTDPEISDTLLCGNYLRFDIRATVDMSRSPPREQSPDESGYLTHIPGRNSPPSEEYDPSEHEYSDSEHTPVRSATPTPDPTPCSTPECERTPIPVRDEAGPSRPRGLRLSPPSLARIPALPLAGMTEAETYWVRSLYRSMERCRVQVDYHEHSIDSLRKMMSMTDNITKGMISMMGTSDEMIGKIFGELAETRAMVTWLHTCLSPVMGFLVVIVALVMVHYWRL
ncbi:hypothetical protein L6452_34322 [Arctium lappa]|uniref:Uncharacterized protein n=1 Tax=Arctium lappa TaxID=4217 RepID=A0ACB8YJG8_ARCLA|nr:hypothetical protein L6452_34322 [Arctium lappa]